MASHSSEGDRKELNPLRLYLDQADQTPLLTPEEEEVLAMKIHRGIATQAALLARAKMILGNTSTSGACAEQSAASAC